MNRRSLLSGAVAMVMLAAAAVAGYFFATQRQLSSIQVTASGLQYEVLAAGRGPVLKMGSPFSLHYRLFSPTGVELESSYSGPPVSGTVGDQWPGAIEGLQLMSPGAKYRFTLPYQPAFGKASAGASTLVYEVELLNQTGDTGAFLKFLSGLGWLK